MPPRLQTLLALLLALPGACGPQAAPAPTNLRVSLAIAPDPALEPVARSLEARYELDRPDIDVVLVNADADVRLIETPDPASHAEAIVIRREVGILVASESRLRLIDLSRGTCDVVIGRRNTPLGDLALQTLADRAIDESINPRLLEVDAEDLVDWVVDRNAIGIGYVTLAADRPSEVRVLADGAHQDCAIVPVTGRGQTFTSWLTGGVTTRRPLREHGFDLAFDPLHFTPPSPDRP